MLKKVKIQFYILIESSLNLSYHITVKYPACASHRSNCNIRLAQFVSRFLFILNMKGGDWPCLSARHLNLCQHRKNSTNFLEIFGPFSFQILVDFRIFWASMMEFFGKIVNFRKKLCRRNPANPWNLFHRTAKFNLRMILSIQNNYSVMVHHLKYRQIL